MPRSVRTFLMFDGVAEEAMTFYVSVFQGAAVHETEGWAAGEQGPEGTLKRARFSLAGHEIIAFNSPAPHQFTFTPSISLFVECESEAEIDEAHAKLSAGGKDLMPLGSYGFSKKFAWFNDRYGVSWQLNLTSA